MFLPLEIGQIYGVLEVIYKVINIGWSNVHNAHQQYLEFKQDIEILRDQLDTLHDTIKHTQARKSAQLAPRGQLSQVFDNFKETLEDCHRLLKSQEGYGTHQGPVSNIRWFLSVKDEVNMHRDRIAVLNAKLSLALQSLEIQSREGQSVLILECTNVVLERINLLDARIALALGEPLPTESSCRIDVPEPLKNFFEFIITPRYGSLTRIPMAQGVDEVIFYLDRATQWHVRRQSTQRCHAFKLANILRAYWLLQATKASEEYQEVSSRATIDDFERQFPRLGMTARRFFGKLEEKIIEAHSHLTRSGEPTPSLHELQEVLEQDCNAWQDHTEWTPQKEEEDDNPRRGERVATCRLRNTNASTAQSLELYQQGEGQDQLTVIHCGGGRADIVHPIDLKCLCLTPSPEAATFSSIPYSVSFKPVKGRSQNASKFTFRGEEDLFEFQEWMTGHKVVDDFPNTVVTSQRANAVIGGERRRDTGRVQIWSSTRSSPGPQLPDEFLDSEPSSSKARRSPLSRAVSPYSPVLPPLALFSSFSLSLKPTRSPSSASALLDVPIAPRTRSGTPSLIRTSTITSSNTSRSSASSMSGLTPRRPANNTIQVDKRGNIGCILDQPDPPRLVVFLPLSDAQRQGSRPKGPAAESGSLLVIDINQNIRINPTLCDCPHDPRTSQTPAHIPNGHHQQPATMTCSSIDRNGILSLDIPTATHPAPPSQPQCRKVILQVVNGSGITAQETEEESAWNLASAGRYQDGEGLGRVKRLKKVGLVFRGVDERVRFVKYFTDLRELYLGHLNAMRR